MYNQQHHRQKHYPSGDFIDPMKDPIGHSFLEEIHQLTEGQSPQRWPDKDADSEEKWLTIVSHGIGHIDTSEDLVKEFTERDIEDITRENGYLRVGENAKIINTGNGTAEEVSAILVRYIRQMQKKRVLTEKIAKAETYAELAPIAMEMIDSYIKYQQEKKLPEWMEMVCGPISTGWLGTIDANIAHFNEHIKNLVLAGNPIFDQTIFEEAILRIKTKRREDGIVLGGQYDDKILTDFYQPLFESGKIKKMHFIPWRMSSKGAIRERRQAELLGIDEIDLKTLSITSPSPN